jgi:hypothetical protein
MKAGSSILDARGGHAIIEVLIWRRATASSHNHHCSIIRFEGIGKVEQDDKNAQPFVTIKGEKVYRDDLTEQQTYLLRQMQYCQAKINRLTFEMEQMKAALTTFDQQLASTVKSKKRMG